MADDQDTSEINKKLLELVNNILQSPEWESSQVLSSASKPLVDMRDKLRALVEADSAPGVAAMRRKLPNQETGVKIYVSLYQADGDNMVKWQQVLKNISEYSVTRPIYAQESQVQALLRTKTDLAPEGYVVVFVAQDDIQPSLPGATDQQGAELLSLKSGALNTQSILEFVHRENRYDWYGDELHLKT